MKNYALIESGQVVNIIVWDGESSTWQPPPSSKTVLLPEGIIVMIGQKYIDGEFLPVEIPPLPESSLPTAAQVLAQRMEHMATATAEIAPLQDLVDLGEASEDDEDKLLEWKQYRAAVSKVQTQPGFPASVVWPEVPEI